MEPIEEQSARQEPSTEQDVRGMIRNVIEEFLTTERRKAEPAYKAELVEERRRREQLERQVNQLVEENQKAKKFAEESDRNAQIRSELQRLGVIKVELAHKAVKDDIQRTPDGALVARTAEGELPVKEYLTKFVQENPEFLPARIAGGSGMTTAPRSSVGSGIELESIRPGMSAEEMQRVREQIAQVALQTWKGE
ncbi:MAG: hypothetical protein P4K98_09300 [Bryobacteraceae bacterium]|jgi:hypothetical protein|nr:hypothetical protein [Bryobacteraceae bacterium]